MTSWAPSHVAQVRTRFAARGNSRALLIALAVAALAAEALALKPLMLDREGPIDGLGVVFGLVGGSFAAFGLVAWRRRPDSRSGVLMAATGFAFFASPLLGQLDAPLAFTVLTLLVDLWLFLFVALLLTLLTAGRLQRGFDRWLVAAYAVPLTILQLGWLLFAELDNGVELNGRNLLLAFPNQDVAYAIDRTQRGLLALLCLVTVVVIVVRWWGSSGPRRRALLPSLAGALSLLFFTLLLITDLVNGTRSQALLWLAALSLVIVPAAFAASLLRSRLARGGLAGLIRDLGTMQGDELRQALARTLGDPDLTVAYWLPSTSPSPTPTASRSRCPGRARSGRSRRSSGTGARIAALVYDASLEDDPELLEAVSAAAGIALENAHLHAESRASLAELRASRSGSSRRATPSAADSSATCTTARNSGWLQSRCSCVSCRIGSATIHPQRNWWRRPVRSSPGRSPSCASLPAESIRRRSSTGLPPR